jgi:hypothetical protein
MAHIWRVTLEITLADLIVEEDGLKLTPNCLAEVLQEGILAESYDYARKDVTVTVLQLHAIPPAKEPHA